MTKLPPFNVPLSASLVSREVDIRGFMNRNGDRTFEELASFVHTNAGNFRKFSDGGDFTSVQKGRAKNGVSRSTAFN